MERQLAFFSTLTDDATFFCTIGSTDIVGYALQHSKIVEMDGKMFFILVELQLFFVITSKCRNVLLIIVVFQKQVVDKE